ncbi:MAG: hypothetical protein K2X93_21210 [Candidatus Obscuribacterales bacterium]|nr:hypothetical protein [Candidatus Obscuribacterales bacterium]
MLDGHTGSPPGAANSLPWLDLCTMDGATSRSDKTNSGNQEQATTDTSADSVSLYDSIMGRLKPASTTSISIEQDFEAAEVLPDNAAQTQPSESVSILGYIPAERIGLLSEAQVRALDPKEFSNLSAEKLQAFRPQQLALLNPAQLQAIQLNDLKPEQIATLTPAQIKVFNLPQISQLEPMKFRTMSNQQLEALSAAQLNSVQPKCLETLSPQQLHSAVHDRQTALSTEQLSHLSREQMEIVTNDLMVGRLTVAELKNLSADSLRRLAPADVKRLLPGQVGALSAEQLRSMLPEQVAMLGGSQLAAIPTESLSHVLPAGDVALVRQVRATLDDNQLPSDQEFRALTARGISCLSSQQLERLLSRYIKHVAPSQLSQLSTDQIRGLESEGLRTAIARIQRNSTGTEVPGKPPFTSIELGGKLMSSKLDSLDKNIKDSEIPSSGKAQK